MKNEIIGAIVEDKPLTAHNIPKFWVFWSPMYRKPRGNNTPIQMPSGAREISETTNFERGSEDCIESKMTENIGNEIKARIGSSRMAKRPIRLLKRLPMPLKKIMPAKTSETDTVGLCQNSRNFCKNAVSIKR